MNTTYQYKSLLIRLDKELYEKVKHKCKTQFGIGIAPLIKIFLKAFSTQRGVGFFVCDEDLQKIVFSWLRKKRSEKGRESCARMPGKLLKDIYGFDKC